MGPELIAIAAVISAVTGSGADTLRFGNQIAKIAEWLLNRPSPAEKDLAKIKSLVSLIHQKLLTRSLTIGLLVIVTVVGATFVTGNVGVAESDGADLGIGLAGAGGVSFLTFLRQQLRLPIVTADEAAILQAYEMAYSRYVVEERAKLKILNDIDFQVLSALSPHKNEAMNREEVKTIVGADAQNPSIEKVAETLDFLKAAGLAQDDKLEIRFILRSGTAKEDRNLKFYRTGKGTDTMQTYSEQYSNGHTR